MRLECVLITGVLCVLAPNTARGQTPASRPPTPILLRHATLLDGVRSAPQHDVAITLRDGRIASIRPDDHDTPDAGAPDSVIDLRGAWVTPGLIDAHAHLGTSRTWGEPDTVAAQRALDAGVTTVRSMGSVPGLGDVALRNRFLEGGSRLPRVLAAGAWVIPIVNEAWLEAFPTLRSLLTPATAADSALRLLPGDGWRLGGNAAAIDSAVALLALHGADWVKAFATGRGGIASSDPRTPLLAESDLRAAVLAARRRGLQVAAHAYTDEGIGAAVLAGARTIEHGAFATEESLRLMREHGACLVPTLAAYDEPAPDSALRARAALVRAAAADAVRQAQDLGVAVIAGTDMPYAPGGYGLAAELRALGHAGLTPDEVLRAATSQAAACLGIDDSTGSVTPGLEADLLVLDGDPRADLALLETPRLVILRGRLVRRVPVADVIHAVLLSQGIDAASDHVRALHRARLDSLRYGEYELVGLAVRLAMQGQVPDALALFQVNTEVYPHAPNAWDALGQAFLMVRRADDARHAFARAVELAEAQGHPRLPEFRARLARLPQP